MKPKTRPTTRSNAAAGLTADLSTKPADKPATAQMCAHCAGDSPIRLGIVSAVFFGLKSSWNNSNIALDVALADPLTLRAALATVIEDITLYWTDGGPRKYRFQRRHYPPR